MAPRRLPAAWLGPLAVGAVLGALGWGLVRFALAPWPDPPHYHANWAVVVNGEELDFSADHYMQPVAACAAADIVLPVSRVHMHNNDDQVVHVHHAGVTWGHFLQNLGMAVGDDYLIVDANRRFFAEGGRTLEFVVNGFVVSDIATRLIASGDRLLISYGPEGVEEVAGEQFSRVASNAEVYDERDDPAGCSGAADVGVMDRLQRAFWGTP